MSKLVPIFCTLCLVLLTLTFSAAGSSPFSCQPQEDQSGRVYNPPQRRRRRAQPDIRRHRKRGIGSAFGKAGKSAGRGGKHFGKQMARGRPLRAGKEFGKGMGGFGKHFGKGMGRVGKRIAKP